MCLRPWMDGVCALAKHSSTEFVEFVTSAPGGANETAASIVEREEIEREEVERKL